MIPHEQLERYLDIVREDINKRLVRLEEKVAALERIVGKFDEVKDFFLFKEEVEREMKERPDEKRQKVKKE